MGTMRALCGVNLTGAGDTVAAASRRPDRQGWRRLPVLAGVALLAACSGSPATLAERPTFDITTPVGVSSVAIRNAPTGMTDDAFTSTVMDGMLDGCRCTYRLSHFIGPYPDYRIVWHVDPTVHGGMSHLVVRMFNGGGPFVYAQDDIRDGASRDVLEHTVAMLTRRLMHQLDPASS